MPRACNTHPVLQPPSPPRRVRGHAWPLAAKLQALSSGFLGCGGAGEAGRGEAMRRGTGRGAAGNEAGRCGARRETRGERHEARDARRSPPLPRLPRLASLASPPSPRLPRLPSLASSPSPPLPCKRTLAHCAETDFSFHQRNRRQDRCLIACFTNFEIWDDIVLLHLRHLVPPLPRTGSEERADLRCAPRWRLQTRSQVAILLPRNDCHCVFVCACGREWEWERTGGCVRTCVRVRVGKGSGGDGGGGDGVWWGVGDGPLIWIPSSGDIACPSPVCQSTRTRAVPGPTSSALRS